MSSRHHYLPRFYIKGFTNNNGAIYVLDKLKGEISNRPFSPKQIFFEWNGNTVESNNLDKEFIEKGYAELESKLAHDIKELVQNTARVQYNNNSYFSTLLLASLIYWRLPVNDEKVTHLLNSNSDELFFEILNKDSGQPIDGGIKNRLINNPDFYKFFRLTRAVIEFQKFKVDNNFLFTSDERLTVGRILSDNPIVILGKENDNFLTSKFIMPINKRVEFISSFQDKGIDKFEPDFRVKLDILRIAQAKRYAGSDNQKYLTDIWHIAKEVNTPTRLDYYRQKIENEINPD